MKTVVLAVFTLLFTQRVFAVTASELKSCMLYPSDAIMDYDHNQTFLFSGAKLYEIMLPSTEKTKDTLVPLDLRAFPAEKQNCFAFNRVGRVKFDDLSADEFRACQAKRSTKPPQTAAFAEADSKKLNQALNAVLQQWVEEVSEVSSAVSSEAADDRAFGKRRWTELREMFKGCDGLSGLDSNGQMAYREAKEQLTNVGQLIAEKEKSAAALSRGLARESSRAVGPKTKPSAAH